MKDLIKRVYDCLDESNYKTYKTEGEGEYSLIKIGDNTIPFSEDVEKVDKQVRDLISRCEREGFTHSRLIKDTVLKYLLEKKFNFCLVGGAVLDIWEGKKPKDYDFTSLSEEFLRLDEVSFVDTSATADTYRFRSFNIQVLKTDINDFDYTISKNFIFPKTDYHTATTILSTKLHKCLSYKTKVLIPVSYKKENALNALLRYPHYRKKGYTLKDNTYRSLLMAATSKPEYMKNENKNS